MSDELKSSAQDPALADIPTGAEIVGITVEIDRHCTNTIQDSIRDDYIFLRDSSGPVGLNRAITDWWDTSDDNIYNIYGGSEYLWGASWTPADINSATFGVDIAVRNDGSSNTAYIDHVYIKINYTETVSPTLAYDITRPDGDISTQWEASGTSDHYTLIDEIDLDLSDYIYTSSDAGGNVIDWFSTNSFDISGGIITQVQVLVYGQEINIDSTINLYCGSWLGAKQLEMSSLGLHVFTWTDLSLTQAHLEGMEVKFESVPPTSGGSGISLLGQFSEIEGSESRFTYNWTDIQNDLSVSTGETTDIFIKLVDIDSGTVRNISYSCLIDFETPTSTIAIGDGITDYSQNNYAAPWTLFDVSSSDNMEGILNHEEYYYSEAIKEEFQVKVFDTNDNLVHRSGFATLSSSYNELFDLGVPVKGYEDHALYYYVIEVRITDAAGNNVVNSSYLGDSYPYEGGAPKILVSNQVTIQFEDNLIDVNDLYSGIGDLVNFTLIGPDFSELKNKEIQLKSGNYYLKVTIWNETTQSYQVRLDNLYDLVLYSDNIFNYQLYSNYEIDNKLNWDAMGNDYYAFAKLASQSAPLGLRFMLQDLRSAILYVPEKDGFKLTDFLTIEQVSCYKWNDITQKYDNKYVFNSSEYSFAENGTLTWNIDLDQMNVKDNEILIMQT